MYENEYLDKERVEETFDKVCYAILQVLPEIRKTRWCHLVDFYTLFHVLADKLDEDTFVLEPEEMHIKLVQFSEWVNLLQKHDFDYSIDNKYANEYSQGIRNSSDLNSRRKRYTALKEYLFSET